uniref:Uncharacterized protein n=1 Tax=Steinernema glaseri TaxID=37863 RepID=A0A1I7YDS9_9BILA
MDANDLSLSALFYQTNSERKRSAPRHFGSPDCCQLRLLFLLLQSHSSVLRLLASFSSVHMLITFGRKKSPFILRQDLKRKRLLFIRPEHSPSRLSLAVSCVRERINSTITYHGRDGHTKKAKNISSRRRVPSSIRSMCGKGTLKYGSAIPPFFKYAVFYVCGFELIFNAVLMSVAQTYYETSSIVFPVAYRMFEDTVQRQTVDFQWTPVEAAQLEQYQTKLIALWTTSTFCIIYAVFCIVPQFYIFEEADEDNEMTVCLKFPSLGWYMGVLYVLFMIACGTAIVWVWLTCQADHDLFHHLFLNTLKEEHFLSELEEGLQCTSDDDKEVHRMNECDNRIDRSMLSSRWMTPVLITFFVGHIFVWLTFPFFNKSFQRRTEEPREVKAKLVEA